MKFYTINCYSCPYLTAELQLLIFKYDEVIGFVAWPTKNFCELKKFSTYPVSQKMDPYDILE